MALETDKEQVLSGIYHAKEVLFFVIGLATLISIPFVNAGSVGTIQLCVMGAILTIEGFSEVVEMTFNFMIQRGLPWIDRNKKKMIRRRG